MNQSGRSMALGMAAGMLFLLSGSYGLAQQIGYVDISQPSEGNGASWSTAFKTLTNALTRIAGTGTTTLWVAQGIYYTPTAAGTDITTNSLYGGYPTGGVGSRDWVNNPTILSGGGSNRVLQKSGAAAATLDGFFVVNGTNAAGGAGINATAGNLTINNSTFTNNLTAAAGGAISQSKAAAFSNCAFVANKAGTTGGAIQFPNAGTNAFYSCSFFTNTATTSGGAIDVANNGGLLQFTGCAFSNNVAGGTGGGAIYTVGWFDLSGGNDVFYGNYSSGPGGAIFQGFTGSSNIFSNCAFTANKGAGGGAIRFSAKSTNVFQVCTFTTNYSTSTGGAISEGAGGGLLKITGCAFTNNTAPANVGGALYSQGMLDLSGGGNVFNGNTAGSQGGAIYNSYGATNNVFSNCTFTANVSTNSNGGAIYFATISTNVFQSCTFVTNSAPASAKAGGAIYDNVAGLDRWTGCTFSNNTCSTGGGGAIYSKGRLDLSGGNDLFCGNAAAGGGGGAIANAYAATNNIFSNCTFVANVGCTNNGEGYGGAVYIGSVSTNVFLACTFVSNSVSGDTTGYNYGGAIAESGQYAAGGLLRLTGCAFSNNFTVHNGGGAVAAYGTLDLSGGYNLFYGNSCGGGGGAISHWRAGASNVFNNCTFVANVAANGNIGYGGAIYIGNPSTNVFLACTFVTNVVPGVTNQYSGGGAIAEDATYAIGGLLRLTGCAFSNNVTTYNSGGAIFSYGTLDLSGGNNQFYGNACGGGGGGYTGSGGAIFNSFGASNHVFSNCTFIANMSGIGQNGGAIYFNAACTATVANCAFVTNAFFGGNSSGGAIYIYGSGLYALVNCTFFANQSTGTGQGGAVRTRTASTLNVTNCIFWGNVGGTGTGTNIQNGGTLNLGYSDIKTNAGAISGGTLNFGTGIINGTDPLFGSTVVPYDVHLQSQYGRWTPGGWAYDAQTSPCIDAGNPASDYTLEPQPNGGRIDLGAYGDTVQASRSKSGRATTIILR